jgi:hypothetical protein
MHKMRFTQPEEEAGFFVYTFVTEAIYLLFPFVRALWGAGFADDLPLRQQKKLMKYYRSCLQRHLYLNGPDKVLLSKATQFSGSILCLQREFPDARIINILRNPRESIPSHISVFFTVWQWIDPSIRKNGPESREYAELAAAWFLHLEKFAISARPELCYRILYPDLVQNTERSIQSIYRRFGLPLSAQAKRQIRSDARLAVDYKSSHLYTMAEYGLSPEWLRRELGGLMKRHRFSAATPPRPSPRHPSRKTRSIPE